MKKFFIITIILMTFLLGKAQNNENYIPQVLVIQSYHSGFLWSDNIDSAIKQTLKTYDNRIRIKTEFLDTKRFNTPSFRTNLKMMLEYKYKDSHFDVIITADNNAFEIIKELHKSVFHETPVVFCGVNYFHPSQLGDMKNVTGVREKIVSLENFQLIKRLHKNVKKIIVLNEMTPTGKQNRVNIQADIREFKEDIAIEIVEDVSIEELKNLLSNLDDDTIVLYSIFFKDNQGHFLEYDESIMLVAQYSRVPVYVSIDFSLGYGAVGGYLTSGTLQGENAAQLAIKILQGQDAEKLDITDVSPNNYYFDYKALQKWGIKISDLPENSVIINYEKSYWESHKDLLIRFIIVVFFLSIIIIYLIITVIKKNHLKNQLIKSNNSLLELKSNLEEMVLTRTQELATKEEKYRSVYENSGIAMITVDEKGIVTMVNKKFEELSGYQRDEVVNKMFWLEFVDDSDIMRMKKNRELRYESKLPETDNYEIKLLNKTGFVIDAILNVVLVPQTKEIISTITDISAKNAVQHKTKLLLEEQKAFIEVKNNFYKNFGQDLNIPVKSITGLIELVRNSDEKREIDNYLQIIQNLAGQLQYIVSEMNNYQLNPPENELLIEEVYLPEFIRFILEFLLDRSNIKKIYYKIAPELEKKQYLITSQLEKLLEIVLIKVAKSDPSIPLVIHVINDGEMIKFDISLNEIHSPSDFIEIVSSSNSDNNVNDLKNISDFRFNYLIMSKLVSTMQGKIEFNDEIYRDKKFIFTIKKFLASDVTDYPAEEAEQNSIEKYILPNEIDYNAYREILNTKSLKVLIVNYSSINHFVIYKMLEVLNQKVEVCPPEKSLNDFLEQDTFDLIIMDMNVISINNLDTLKEIRSKKNIYQPYIVVEKIEDNSREIYDLINAELPEIINISNIAILLQSAFTHKSQNI